MVVIIYEVQNLAPWTLLYADDVALMSDRKADFNQQVQAWRDHLSLFGFHLNVKKLEYMMMDTGEFRIIQVNGIDLPHADEEEMQSIMIDVGSLKSCVGSLCVTLLL